MLAAQDVAVRCKEIGITALHIKLRATGGNRWVMLDLCYHLAGLNPVIKMYFIWCYGESPLAAIVIHLKFMNVMRMCGDIKSLTKNCTECRENSWGVRFLKIVLYCMGNKACLKLFDIFVTVDYCCKGLTRV